MYTKITCPHCEKNSYHNISITLEESRKNTVLIEVEVVDTLQEADLIKIVSNFISKNVENEMDTKDLQALLNRCFGLSPQFTEELIKKCKIRKSAKR